LLENNTKILRDFPLMPYPNNFVRSVSENRLMFTELDYVITEMKSQFDKNYKSLTG